MSFYRKEYMKRWREKNREHLRELNKKCMKKRREMCRKNGLCLKCYKTLTESHSKILYHKKCLLRERERNKKWRIRNVEKERERGRKKAFNYKIFVLQKVSKQKIPCCINCKTKDIRVLCVNHKNGRREEERGKKVGYSFYLDIIKNRRKISDLDVRCANCNIIYEYERGKRRENNLQGGLIV